MTELYKSSADNLGRFATELRQRIAEEQKAREDGEKIRSPLDLVANGGTFFDGTRPYTYLATQDFERLDRVDELLPWSDAARRHVPSRLRRDALERVLGQEVETPSADLEAKLHNLVGRLEKSLQEYTFIFPLDNMELPESYDVRTGRSRLRRLSEDWKRYCAEVFGAVQRLDRTDEDKGAILANHLLGEEDLRKTEPILEVRAWGSPESAYQAARDEAHFALALLKFFATPFDGGAGQIIALKGENQERRRGWRLRFAAGGEGPAMWADGTGPALPLSVDPPEGWSDDTKEFMDALNLLLDEEPRSEVAKKLTTSIYWAGTALNQSALASEARPSETRPAEGGTKPTGIETGRLIRDMVTATAAILKERNELGDKQAIGRLGRIVQSLDSAWYDKHWSTVGAAYKARNEWTHEGVGMEERAGAVALVRALQAVVPLMIVEAAKGRIRSAEDLIKWIPETPGGAER